MMKLIKIGLFVLAIVIAMTFAFNLNKSDDSGKKGTIDTEWKGFMQELNNSSEEYKYKTKELILQMRKHWDKK